MSVAWLTSDLANINGVATPGGCAYYRCVLPMRAVGKSVEQVVGHPAWTGEQGFGVRRPGGLAQFGFKTVVLKLLFDRSLVHQIRVARALGQRVVVDVDDFYEELHEDNVASKAISSRRRESYNSAAIEADIITVSTPVLQDYYREMHPDVRLIRNGIDYNRYDIRKGGLKPVIGWAGAIPWRSGDVEILRDVLPAIMEEFDLRFVHLGHVNGYPSFAELSGVDPKRITTYPMVNIYAYPQAMSQFDIGLVPLNDIPFNRAKSNLKGMEYAAAGILPIASALPEYERLWDDNVAYKVCRTAEDWDSAIRNALSLNYSQRLREAREERRNLILNYSMDKRAGAWKEVVL